MISSKRLQSDRPHKRLNVKPLVVVRAMVRSTLNEREWRVCNIPVPSFLESWITVRVSVRTRVASQTLPLSRKRSLQKLERLLILPKGRGMCSP